MKKTWYTRKKPYGKTKRKGTKMTDFSFILFLINQIYGLEDSEIIHA
jgi:hypothetical protein